MLYWAFDKSKTPYYPWLISFRVGPYRSVFWSPEFRQGQALPRVAGCIESEMGLLPADSAWLGIVLAKINRATMIDGSAILLITPHS